MGIIRDDSMTSKLSNDGWAVFSAGFVLLMIGLLPVFNFVAKERAILVGVGGMIMFLSSLYMTEDVKEPEESDGALVGLNEQGFEIKKEVE